MDAKRLSITMNAPLDIQKFLPIYRKGEITVYTVYYMVYFLDKPKLKQEVCKTFSKEFADNREQFYTNHGYDVIREEETVTFDGAFGLF